MHNVSTELDSCFADSLKQARKKARFTQVVLANKCNLDPTYISMLERGVRRPSLQTLLDLASALNITASSFVIDIEHRIQHHNDKKDRRTNTSYLIEKTSN